MKKSQVVKVVVVKVKRTTKLFMAYFHCSVTGYFILCGVIANFKYEFYVSRVYLSNSISIVQFEILLY